MITTGHHIGKEKPTKLDDIAIGADFYDGRSLLYIDMNYDIAVEQHLVRKLPLSFTVTNKDKQLIHGSIPAWRIVSIRTITQEELRSHT